MQDSSQNIHHCHANDTDNFHLEEGNSDEEKMLVTYGYEDLDESPFDEPPVSAEIDLDRLVDAWSKSAAPPRKVTPMFASKNGASPSSSPSREEQPRQEYQQREKRRQRLSVQRYGNRTTAKKLPKGKKKGRSISFSDKLVDVVPEVIGGVQTTAVSVASSRPGGGPAADDRSYQSFLTFENSLEYFLKGEWIEEEVDLLLAPVQCKPKEKGASTAKGEGRESRFCDCLGLLDPADYTSKPFSVPFKWKEYTSLDTECLDVEKLCRNDESWVNSDHVPRQQRSSRRSLCSEDDDDVEENDSLTTARHSVTNSLREMLPPLESLKNILGGFFQGPCDRSQKKEKRKRRKRSNSNDAMSMSAASTHNCDDSQDSTLANPSIGVRVNATAE